MTETASEAPRAARLRDAPLLIALVVSAQFVVLQLVLRTSFLGDDAPNQVIAGYADQLGKSVPAFLWQMTVDQYHGLGRVTPVGLFQNYGLNALVHDRATYKLVLVAATVVSTLMLASVLVAVRIPVAVALLGAGLTAPLWQLHQYHDPLVSYGALSQMVLILGCASTLCHLRWLRGGSPAWAIVSVGLLIWANLTYEAAYLMVGMLIGATVIVGARFRTAVPAALTTVAFVAFLLSIRTDGGQYAASFGIQPTLTTLAKQVTAGLPGAGWFDPLGAQSLTPVPSTMAWVRGVLVAALLLPVVRAALLAARPVALTWRRVLGLAILLGTPAFLPAALVSLAARYQAELRWGTGYLPLALTVPALAAGAAVLLWWLGPKVPRRALLAAAAVIIVGAVGVNASGSMRVVSNSFTYGQNLDDLRSIAKAGTFDRVPAGTTFLFDQTQIQPGNGFWLPGYLYSPSNWLYVHAGRRWPAFPVPAGQTDELCVDTYGQGVTPPCPVLRGAIAWVTTALDAKQRRWLLITPGTVTKSGGTLADAPARGPATLIYPRDAPKPPVMYAPAPGVPQRDLDPSLVTRTGDLDDWAVYTIKVAPGTPSGSGRVSG